MNLHQHEGEEKQVEQPQGDAYFDDAQPRRRQVKPPGKIPFASDHCSPQEAGDNPGHEGGQERMTQQAEEVQVKNAGDNAVENRITGHEESAEEKQQRESNEKPAPDRN